MEKNGRKLIVGVVMYHFKYSTWVGQVVHLGNIAVDPQFQRKGVATKLMQHIGQVEILLIIFFFGKMTRTITATLLHYVL